MSDTQPADAFATEKLTRSMNGADVPCTMIRFGTVAKVRTLILKDSLGPGDYLDAIETYGGTKSDNAEGLALVAFRLVELDGAPIPPYRSRTEVHAYLNKLGNDGVAAIARSAGVSQVTATEDTPDVVGN